MAGLPAGPQPSVRHPVPATRSGGPAAAYRSGRRSLGRPRLHNPAATHLPAAGRSSGRRGRNGETLAPDTGPGRRGAHRGRPRRSGAATSTHRKCRHRPSRSSEIGDRARLDDIGAAVASCGGNPLLLMHVAAEVEAGRALPDHGRQSGGSWASRLLLSRFIGMGPAGEAYLQAASVLGGRFRPEIAAEVAGLGPADAADALRALVGAGLLVDAGDGWTTFSHHLVRLAVYDQVAPQTRWPPPRGGVPRALSPQGAGRPGR